MKPREANDRHFDLGPSNKDWEPGGPGRTESLAPEKHRSGRAVEPGTADERKRRQARRSDLKHKQEQLDEALKESFPASDPPAHSDVTGWDIEDEAEERAGKRRQDGRPGVSPSRR